MPWKVSFLIDYNSEPVDLAYAAVHKGGWSETIWWNYNTPPNVVLGQFAQKRAPLLVRSCRIIGARVQTYALVGGQLIAGGVSTTAIGKAGNPVYDADLPQVSLSLIGRATTAPNVRRFVLRGFSDAVMKGGEWGPGSGDRAYLTSFRNFLSNSGWCFPGRDLSKPTVNIVSIINGVLKLTDASLFAVGDYVRLLKVKDLFDQPVTGVYRVSAKTGNDLTLENFGTVVVTKNVGKARVESHALYQIGSVEVGRACVKKIGRPFEQYRGRRSKRRAA